MSVTKLTLIKVFYNLIALSLLFTLATCFSCDTPDEWLSGNARLQNGSPMQEEGDAAFANTRIGQLWPNGIVKYKFHSSLTLRDMYEVKKAFEEFHSKTCVRFEPWKEGDRDFVSIEVDNRICGKSKVCKIGGYQYARFGNECRTMSAMVHELGHTLCLAHEHQRSDRDNYLNFRNCSENPRKLPNTRHSSVYDYASQMHYECNFCGGGWATAGDIRRCGPDFSSGLSILDVEVINSLYNCQGCQRHRWIPLASLIHEDKANMYNFGLETKDGNPLYICRALIFQELTPGVYDETNQACNVTITRVSHNLKNGVELLTIPGGPNAQCSNYQFVHKSKAVPMNFVQAGPVFNNRKKSLHITFATKNVAGQGSETALGKVLWIEKQQRYWPEAQLRIGSETYLSETDYEILSCSKDRECMIEEAYRFSQK
ncbi:unnamed protein product [Orchesella dallaii]|uniref:Metalloendopeptidase n=1 Tax=Orchesella dallaii TaxID=48710 RepID=A0ABP1S8D6_9HEXA